MSRAVLDSSAALAVLQSEAGSDIVSQFLPGALVSTVNVAEVMSKLGERGMLPVDARRMVVGLEMQVIDFTFDLACAAGDLRMISKSLGLSLGDRACLALAQARNLPALTSDRAWARLKGFNVVLIRS